MFYVALRFVWGLESCGIFIFEKPALQLKKA